MRKSTLVKCGLAASSRSDWQARPEYDTSLSAEAHQFLSFVLAQRADTDVADSSHECYHRDRAYYEIHLLG